MALQGNPPISVADIYRELHGIEPVANNNITFTSLFAEADLGQPYSLLRFLGYSRPIAAQPISTGVEITEVYPDWLYACQTPTSRWAFTLTGNFGIGETLFYSETGGWDENLIQAPNGYFKDKNSGILYEVYDGVISESSMQCY